MSAGSEGGFVMLGQTFRSEMREFADGVSGRRVLRLTETGDNVHLYFTDNAFTLGDREIYYASTKGTEQSEARIRRGAGIIISGWIWKRGYRRSLLMSRAD